MSIPSPTTPARALAYDPERGTFWVANYDSRLYEIDREGEIVNQFINSLTISGLAWDQSATSTNRPALWSWSQDGSNGHLATQINPEDGTLTGLAFKGARMRDNAGVAGGATIRVINERLTFVGLEQLTADLIGRYDLESLLTPIPWVKTIPDALTLAPNERTQIQVIFDATNFHQTGDYNAELHLMGNFTNDVTPIPLAMQANCPRCASLNGSVSAAHTGNPLRATIRVTGSSDVTNDNDTDFSVKGDNYALSVLPGPHTLTVSANGYMSQTRTIDVTRDELTATNFILNPLTEEQKAGAIRLTEQASIGEPISRTLTLTNSTSIAFNLDLSTFLPDCDTLSTEQLSTTTPITTTLNSDTLLNLTLNLQQITLTQNGITANLNFSALQDGGTYCIQEEERENEEEGENGRAGEGENEEEGEDEEEGESGRAGEGENGRMGEGENEEEKENEREAVNPQEGIKEEEEPEATDETDGTDG